MKRTRLSKNGSRKKVSRMKVDKPFFAKPQLTEQEVLLIKNRLSNKRMHIDEVFDYMPEDGWKLTPEQTKKGLDWLMNQWKTPHGIERKNNPFGYREQNVLEKFKEFRLSDFFDTANVYAQQSGMHFYVPVYDVIGKDGSGFQYYVSSEGIKIIG